jgi:hypothetical protein
MSERVKVVEKDGRRWGVVQARPLGDEVSVVLCSESGALISDEMEKAEYERLPEDGELGESSAQWVEPAEREGEIVTIRYLRSARKQ